MTWISEWLKEIIFVVLIAVFIELLLPNRSMERYVKFVVSLLILLTILSPIIRLFSGDTEQKLATALADNINGLEGYSTNESTALILKQGEELKKKQEVESLQWAGEEAARQMKEQIQREIGQPIERVAVKLVTKSTDEGKTQGDFGSKQTELLISSVEVVIGQSMTMQDPKSSKEGISGSEITIQSVEEVTINVDLQQDVPMIKDKGEKGDKTAMVSTEDTPLIDDETSALTQGKDEATVERIRELLNKEWGVTKETITVMKRENQKN